MATQSAYLGYPIQEELSQSLIRSLVQSWIRDGHGSLGLVVVGEAGQGKSSLINGLLGKQVAAEGGSLDPETQSVEKYSYIENGIAVTLWDTPGFGVDSDEKEEETLQEMVKQFSGKDPIDLMLYCIRMDGARWPKTTDKKTIDKMTKFFGPEIWQCCQFVLTFANQVMGLCPPGEEREGFFTYKIWQYEEKVRKTLIEYAHLTEEDVTQIHVVPVGDPHQHQNKSWELPGIDDWFLNFWLECTCSIRQSALPALIKLNRHRITEMPEDISSPNPPALYQHHVPSYAAELPEPTPGTSSKPQYAGLEAPDQCEPASNEPSSPMPSLTQSHDNSSINIDQVESQQLTAPPTIDDGAESPQPTSSQLEATENPTNRLENHPISLYCTLQNQLKNENSGFWQYIKTYSNKRGNQVPVFGHFEGVIEGLISWLGSKLSTAVRKMRQHQSLAEDIRLVEQERRRIIQKESEERSKELYNQFFCPLFESLCNEQVYSSLIDQLVSMSLISEADKETWLSSTQHPKVRTTSLLEVLNIEEKPHLLMELIKAMEEVEELKGLADEMLTQHRANEAGEDVSKKIERQLTGVNVVDEHVFKLEGRRAQPLLWEEHGFRMFIPEDALLPYETCHVSVKAIVGGHFQFPEGTEPVSAVYAISLSRQLRKPARMEMQHCVKLENPEHCKSMSFAVASQDPSSMPYQFHEVPGGIFEENKFFGSVDRQQFSFMTIIWKLLGYDIKCIYSASTFTQKAKMDEQLWILAVSKDLDTMKRYLTSSLKEAEQEIEEVTFEFEKEEITLEILDEATPGWIIEPLITPCTITRRQVESRVQPHNIEHGPIVCKVRIAFQNPIRPPYEVLRNRIRLDGINPERCFNIHFIPPLIRTDSNGSASRRTLLSSVSSSSPSFMCSFDSPQSLDSVVPTQRDFYKMVILKIPSKWKTFGIMLEIDIERLEGILQDKKNSEDCFLEVYRIGKMELDQQFTWKRVLDILHDLKENSLRNKIQDKLLQDNLLDSVVEAS